jgi:hypothetical protein
MRECAIGEKLKRSYVTGHKPKFKQSFITFQLKELDDFYSNEYHVKV